jgi:PAS domain S-box-containing protein
VLSIEDITERKQAEQALQQSEERLAQAVRVAGLGTFEHDHRTDRIDVSPLMRELLGFDEHEEITIPAILERIVPEDREAVAAAIQRAHDPAGNGMFAVECRTPRADGTVRWISTRSQTVFEGEANARRPLRTIGAARDVTERMEAQAGLERLVGERTAKLQELVGDLDHFSYTITHDMRAPLRSIHGFAEMLEEVCGGAHEEAAKGVLKRIKASASRMDSLITDALNYSKTVRQEMAVAPTDVTALLREMLDSYPELQPSKARIDIAGDIPRLMGNQAGLTQCFSNLLGNAVKFVKPGETPEVRIWAEEVERPGAPDESQDRSAAAGPYAQPGTGQRFVRIWVEDKGIGIPKAAQGRVFDLFQRAHKDFDGTGVGLALVRKVTERMGGRVGLESEEGSGSRFWLELRAAGGVVSSADRRGGVA